MASYQINIPITPSDCVQFYIVEARLLGVVNWTTYPNTIGGDGSVTFTLIGGASSSYDIRLTKVCCNGGRSNSILTSITTP